MLLPPSDDLVKVALPRPLGLEDVTGAFMAELELLAAAGLASHPRRLFCFFWSFCSWGFDFAEGI